MDRHRHRKFCLIAVTVKFLTAHTVKFIRAFTRTVKFLTAVMC